MRAGGDMNINKYIELLRFYLVEKIGEISESFKTTIYDEVDNIISSIISAIFAVFISDAAIQLHGFWGVVLRTVLVVVIWFLLKYILLKALTRFGRTTLELEKSRKKQLEEEQIKNWVDQFDHIACDGMLLSRDYLRQYSANQNLKDSEKEFCVIEAFYYYKKSLTITARIVSHAESCVNGVNKDNGIAKYRLRNIYISLCEICNELLQILKKSQCADDFLNEFCLAHDSLNDIRAYFGEEKVVITMEKIKTKESDL